MTAGAGPSPATRRPGGASGIPACELPPFYCPIAPAIHAEHGEAERRALRWVDRLGFCRSPAERARVAGTNSAEFYARFAPEADLERLWVTACWVYWGFAFDDACCDEGALSTDPAAFSAVAGRAQHALETPGPYGGDDPYTAALHDLGERFRACATPVQVRRFHQAHRAWLSGVQWQVGNRARGRMPGVDEYLAMRLHSAGGEPTYAMLEIANGAEVPAREMDAPVVRALTEMAILVAALDNDRHSLAKEAGRRQAEQNIFTVLMRQDGSPPGRAARDAVALRDRVLLRFLALRERTVPRASRELRRYLADLGHGIRGNIEWGVRVPRYLSLEGAAAGPGEVDAPEHLPWTDRALDASDEPLPFPSVSWWWDDLAL